MKRALLVAALAAIAGCPPPPSETPPPAPTIETTTSPAPAPLPEPTPDPAPTAPEPAPAPLPAGAALDGDACSAHADCQSGICEGQGCGPSEGRCVPKQRMCTRDLVAYCGCDGKTFRQSGSCPGARYQNKGPCPGDSAFGP